MDELDRAEIEAAFLSEIEDLEADLVVTYAMAASAQPKARIVSTVRRYTQDFQDYIEGRLEAFREMLHQTVCVDLDYCRRVADERKALAFSIADTVIIAVFGLKFPPITLAVFLIRAGYLDDFCGCHAEARA